MAGFCLHCQKYFLILLNKTNLRKKMEQTVRQELYNKLRESQAIQITRCTFRQAIAHIPVLRQRFDIMLDKLYRYRWITKENYNEYTISRKEFNKMINDMIYENVDIYVYPLKNANDEFPKGDFVWKFYSTKTNKYMFSLWSTSLVGFIAKTGATSESSMVPWSTSIPVPKNHPKWVELATKTLINVDKFEEWCASIYVDIPKKSDLLTWRNDPNTKHRWNKWKLQWSLLTFYKDDNRRYVQQGKRFPEEIPNHWKWSRTTKLHQDLFVKFISKE